MNTCENCKAYEPVKDYRGQCRLNPPRVNNILLARALEKDFSELDAVIEATTWTHVFSDDWCKQYEAADHADNV